MTVEGLFTYTIPSLSTEKTRVSLFVYCLVIFDSSTVTCFNSLILVFYILYFCDVKSLLVKLSNS